MTRKPKEDSIDDLLSPIKTASSLSVQSSGNKKIWNYFLDLVKTSHFQEQIANIRRIGLDTEEKPQDVKRFRVAISRLCRDLLLDEVIWPEILEKYILTMELPSKHSGEVGLILDRSELGEDEYTGGYTDEDGLKHPEELEPWSYSHPVIIRITPYASQREIIEYIKQNSETIKNIQGMYIKPELSLGKSRTKKLSIEARNEFIYKHRHLPRRKIATMVTKEFGWHDNIDYGHVGKIISLEKKKREIK